MTATGPRGYISLAEETMLLRSISLTIKDPKAKELMALASILKVGGFSLDYIHTIAYELSLLEDLPTTVTIVNNQYLHLSEESYVDLESGKHLQRPPGSPVVSFSVWLKNL